MKKILSVLLFTLPFLFAGCGEETTTTTSGDISNPVTETATLEQTVLYSVLKTDKNTTASVKISGVSETAGDTISVSFPESSPAENFTVSQGYAFDNVYGIALYRNSKETSVDKFNVSVKNRLGPEILNKDGYIYTVHKIFPYYTNTQTGDIPVPYPDNHIYTFNQANQSQIILFRQIVSESNESFENGYSNTTSSLPTFMVSSGFDDTSPDINFKVDAQESSIEYNGKMYPNCLMSVKTDDCALKFTSKEAKDARVNYVIKFDDNNKYVDVVLKLQSIAQ